MKDVCLLLIFMLLVRSYTKIGYLKILINVKLTYLIKLKRSKTDNEYINTYLILSSRYSAYIEYSYLTNEDKEILDLKKIYKLIFDSLDRLATELREINIILISPLPEFKYFPFSCFLNKELCKNNIV